MGPLDRLHRLVDGGQAAFRAQAADVRAEQALRIWNSEPMTMAELGRRLGGVSKQRAGKLLERGREVAARQSTAPLPEAIVAAIVTSRRGVLITQRLDSVPPRGFVTGKIEPGESPADAAVREVKEETGQARRSDRQRADWFHADEQTLALAAHRSETAPSEGNTL